MAKNGGYRPNSARTDGEGTAMKRYGSEMRQNLNDAAVTLNQETEEAPQDACDRRGPDYSNNTPVNSWLVGGGKQQAIGKPGYDHGPKFFKTK